jgi:hypothetical protein
MGVCTGLLLLAAAAIPREMSRSIAFISESLLRCTFAQSIVWCLKRLLFLLCALRLLNKGTAVLRIDGLDPSCGGHI